MESSGGGDLYRIRTLINVAIGFTKDKNTSVTFQRENNGNVVAIVTCHVDKRLIKSSTYFNSLEVTHFKEEDVCRKIINDLVMYLPSTKQGN